MVINSKFDNGDVLRDVVTGFTGVCMVVAQYATGCIHCGLLSRELKEDGTMQDWIWLDESRLELVSKEALQPLATPTGGPAPVGGLTPVGGQW